MRSFLVVLASLFISACSTSPVILTQNDPVVESRKVVHYDVSEFTKPLDLSKYRDIEFKTKQDGDSYIVFLEYNHAVLLIELISTLKNEVDNRTDIIYELKKYYEPVHPNGDSEKDLLKTP